MHTYETMIELTNQFYKTIGVEIPTKYIKLAVASLTMPEYAKNYNDVNQIKIKDHSSLATVGDAFCNAYQMLNEYTFF